MSDSFRLIGKIGQPAMFVVKTVLDLAASISVAEHWPNPEQQYLVVYLAAFSMGLIDQ